MLKTMFRALWAIAALQSGLVLGQALRLDGSTDKAADDSFAAMVKAAPAVQRQALLIALVQINMEGVQSAEEAIKTDASRHPSAARVRLKINGMTADEIIGLGKAAQTTTPGLKVKIDDQGDDPGVPSDLLRPLAGGAPREQLAGTTWDVEQTANGSHQHFVYAFNADGTANSIETDRKPGGVNRWEASGNEFRLTLNDGYAAMLGMFDDQGVLRGDGGNQMGFRWAWTATKR